MGAVLIAISIAIGVYLTLVAISEMRDDVLEALDDADTVPRQVHYQRVNELLAANNRELEKRRSLTAAARHLRQAQKVYLTARGNSTPEQEREALGQKVAAAAAMLDQVLEENAR